MTAASPATARTAIFGSCASDHFLNPLVRTVIEIPMISSFFVFPGNIIWGRLSTDSEQNFAIGKETFLRSLCGIGLASKECDAFFNLIREIRGLMAGFFAPQSPKQQFLTDFLVLSIVAGIGPKLAGSRTMTHPSGTFVSTPAAS